MFSAHCLRHMHEKSFKSFDPNDPKIDVDSRELADERGRAREAAKEASGASTSNFVRVVKNGEEKQEEVSVATFAASIASTSDEPVVIEAPKFAPDAYAEDGTPIVYIN